MPEHKPPIRVSVICPFHNADPFLREAIGSVLAQDFPNYELILVDDGSTDSSTHIAQGYARQHRHVRYLEHPGHQNRGISASRNLGLGAALGELVAFIDADDVWQTGKLGRQAALLDAMPDVDVVCGRVIYWGSWQGKPDMVIQSGGVSNRKLAPPQTYQLLFPLGRGAGPSPSDFMFRRLAAAAVGGFEDRFTGPYDDQGFLVKLYLYSNIYFSSEIWTHYRQHPRSCMARSKQDGTYFGQRRAFFVWLRDYLLPRQFAGKPAIMARIGREIRLLDHPLLWKIVWRLNRLADWILPRRRRLDGIIAPDSPATPV